MQYKEVRLIDANALLEEMKKLWNERPASPDDAMGFGIEESITKVKSAPTVETTDDVLERYESIVTNLRNRTEHDYSFSGESQRTYDRGQTDAYEAIIKSIRSRQETRRIP